MIVFIDESGLSERPCRVRTWAPRGRTPVLKHLAGHWHPLSVIAAVSATQFTFRLMPGSVDARRCVEFLKALHATLKCKLLVIWDRLLAHRSRRVQQYLARLRGAIRLEYLPAYAPELNPTEYVWGYLKQRELPNFCPADLAELTDLAHRRLRSMQRRPTLIGAFWRHAGLA